MNLTSRIRVATIGTVWVGSLFVLLPLLAIALNERAGWPRWDHPALAAAGWLLLAGGLWVLVWATHAFRRDGGGTPVPTDPPTRLVTSGLFRFTRNPIFLADVCVLVGLFGVRGHVALLAYAGLVLLGLHVWLVTHEEPVLAKRMGAAWTDYSGRVPRWLGRP